ncbi:hypothetical protein ACIGBL_31870 [Streptomyces sp. NPDC085614]|uniref:hypothetical protein n=1 Tax=Streptomyces sp. NPDC085614 TaxID=3365733 RepID=UPI0037D44AD2
MPAPRPRRTRGSPDLHDPKITKAYAEPAPHYGALVGPERAAKPKEHVLCRLRPAHGVLGLRKKYGGTGSGSRPREGIAVGNPSYRTIKGFSPPAPRPSPRPVEARGPRPSSTAGQRAQFEQQITLEEFDFTASSKLPAAQIRDLGALRWLHAGESATLFGPVGYRRFGSRFGVLPLGGSFMRST